MKERIVGHRGYGVSSPENTLSAIEKSYALGLKYIEFDVRLTQDLVPVISHDDSLKRCAHVDQLISQTLFVDLKDFNVAAYYALETRVEKLPTLTEYIEKATQLGIHCQIELKPVGGMEGVLVEKASEVIDGFFKDKPSHLQPLITSFSPAALKGFKEKSALGCKTGILVPVEETMNWEKLAVAADADYVHVHALYLLPTFAAAMKEKNYRINGYHLNCPELAETAVSLGCERFTCDIPELFS